VKKSIFLIAVLACMNSEAQVKHMFDTIRYDLKQRPKAFFLSLDGKTSIIRDLQLKMFGLQAGYLYNKRTNLYIGYYATLDNESRIYRNPTAGPDRTDSNTIYTVYGLAYFNLGCEYYFYNSRKWRLSFPVGLGIGVGWDKFSTQKKFLEQQNSLVLPIEAGFNASYKLKWWIWLGAGIGTRLSLASGQYNGPFFTYGIQLKTGEIYRRTKKWVKSW
jgi:hypothetical protein